MLNQRHDVRRPANLALKSTWKFLLALVGFAALSVGFGLAGFPNSDTFVASQPMRVYADPGTSLTLITNVLGAAANTNTGASVVMSGYLVDVP